jgi:hypothetical protein
MYYIKLPGLENLRPYRDGYDPAQAAEGHNLVNPHDINPLFQKLIRERGLIMSHMATFIMTAHDRLLTHTDNKSRGVDYDGVKLNWAEGGEDSLVHWYRFKDLELAQREWSQPPLRNRHTIDNYTLHDDTNLEPAASACLQGWYIFQSGQPHAVVTQEKPRRCFSAVFYWSCPVKRRLVAVTMDHARELFGGYL